MAEGIAIVGMALRFPGAKTPGEFFRNLCARVESIGCPSDHELDENGVSSTVRQNPRFVRAGTAVDSISEFDCDFFDIPPSEAEIIDPQQRQLLECALEAFEDAGHNPRLSNGPVGVYATAGSHDYAIWHLYSNPAVLRSAGPLAIMLGNDPDYMATRIAYKLGLRGPALTVQTACSGSLVAVHLACESLLSGECDAAVVCAASLRLPQNSGYLFEEGGILSQDGHCRAFDERAAGTVYGNGAGVVLLKRLADALRDGDHIRAVILGSAVNNDGAAKVGYTAPSVGGQAEVIALAQAVAGVEPDSIGYIEAHGTGTALGDPIEVEALTQAFRAGTARRGFCALGSVKTNIGHLEAAAGMAGLIKTVLCLEGERIAPSLHFEKANPRIEFASSPFYVNAELREWKRGAEVRRAGVSSFGIGGTNAHVVLEEAPAAVESGMLAGVPRLLVLSGKTKTALEEMARRLAEHLEAHRELGLGAVAYTLQVGRGEFRWRRMLVSIDVEEASRRLRNQDGVRDGEAVSRGAELRRAEVLDRGALEALGEQWLQGAMVDWSTLYPAERPKRVPLPAYPFARRRCWIDSPSGNGASMAARLGLEQECAAPTGGTEGAIARIWEDVLGVKPVQPHDRFVELGGNSVQALLVVSKARNAGIHLQIEDLIGGATVAELSL